MKIDGARGGMLFLPAAGILTSMTHVVRSKDVPGLDILYIPRATLARATVLRFFSISSASLLSISYHHLLLAIYDGDRDDAHNAHRQDMPFRASTPRRQVCVCASEERAPRDERCTSRAACWYVVFLPVLYTILITHLTDSETTHPELITLHLFRHEFISIFRHAGSTTVHPSELRILQVVDDASTRYEEEQGVVFLERRVALEGMRR